MLTTTITYATRIMLLLLLTAMTAFAGDLDDDIKIDEKIEKFDALDRPGINIQYIKRSEKATVSSGKKSSKRSGDIAIGGFINKPGASVGDVTIIFNGKDINAINE